MKTVVMTEKETRARGSASEERPARIHEIVRGSLRSFLHEGPGEVDEAAFRALLAEAEWAAVMWMTRRHKVLPPLYEGLSRYADAVPSEVMARLKQQVQVNGLYSLTQSREFLELEEVFAAAGARVIPVGGQPQAALIHGNLALRQSRFIRLRYLVRPEDIPRLEERLTPLGYVFDPDLIRLYKFGVTRSKVIWHTGLSVGRPASAALFEKMWARRKAVALGSRRVQTLAPEDMLLFLCREEIAHHQLHWRRLVEIGALARHPDGFSWTEALETARQTGLEGEVTLQLALAQDLLGVELPEPVLEQVRRPVVRRAAERVKAAALGAAPAYPGRFRFRVGLKSGLGAKADYVWRQGRKDLRAAWKKATRSRDEAKNIGLYAPTPMAVAEQMLRLAEVGPEDRVYDLGCGDGRIVILAAKRFGARGVGIDFDPELVAEARRKAAEEGVSHLVTFIESDVMEADLSPATVATIYLQDFAFPRLLKKLRRDLRPGARIVSHDFFFKSWPPRKAEVVSPAPGQLSHIYLWEVT